MMASTSPRPKAAARLARAASSDPSPGPARTREERGLSVAAHSRLPGPHHAHAAVEVPPARRTRSRPRAPAPRSSRGSAPIAAARSHPCTRWSAASWCTNSSRRSSPYERWTGASDGSVSRTTRGRVGGGGQRRPDGVLAQEVTLETSTHVGGRAAWRRRHNCSADLPGDVVGQVAHRPLAAQCRKVPLLRSHGVDPVGPALDAAVVEVERP